MTQVGIRDCAPAEVEYGEKNGVKTFYDVLIQDRLINGEPFSKIVDDILNSLPSNIYLSIDIDGLEPSNCPNTGTPVSGGLTYNQCLYLLKKLNDKKSIIGADLVELGRFERPRGVVVDSNNRIVVTDCMRGRVQVYSKDKNYLEPQFNL